MLRAVKKRRKKQKKRKKKKEEEEEKKPGYDMSMFHLRRGLRVLRWVTVSCAIPVQWRGTLALLTATEKEVQAKSV